MATQETTYGVTQRSWGCRGQGRRHGHSRLERFAHDMHNKDHIYRAALVAIQGCRTMSESEAVFLQLGYNVRAADLLAVQGTMAST